MSNNMISLILAILKNANTTIFAIPIKSKNISEYSNSLNIVKNIDDVYLIISDNYELSFFNKLSLFVSNAELQNKKYISVISTNPNNSSKNEAIYLANKINNYRISIAYPPILCPYSKINVSHAILSALISKNNDPSSNLIAESVTYDNPVLFPINELDLFQIMKEGISVFESSSYNTLLIRGMTSKTSTNSIKDLSYRNINVILTIDYISNTIIKLLNEFKNNIKLNEFSLSSIKSMLSYILIYFKHKNIISSFTKPNVYIDENQNSICNIDVKISIPKTITNIHIDLIIPINI